MNKPNFKKLALMGITGGILMTQVQAEAAYDNQTTSDHAMKASNKPLSQQDLLSQLSPEGQATYNNLDSEGKALALTLANQSCKGQNDCKGLNSCKSKNNDCAGQGSCKGTSPGPFKDKNDAVKVSAMHMAKKRVSMNDSGTRSNSCGGRGSCGGHR